MHSVRGALPIHEYAPPTKRCICAVPDSLDSLADPCWNTSEYSVVQLRQFPGERLRGKNGAMEFLHARASNRCSRIMLALDNPASLRMVDDEISAFVASRGSQVDWTTKILHEECLTVLLKFS